MASLGILSGSSPLLTLYLSFSFSSLRPTWQHPLVALAQSGSSSPCRAPFAWGHLCFAAIIDRGSYAPPVMPMPTMLTAAVDHLLYVSWHSPTTSRRIFPIPSSVLNVSCHSLHHLFLMYFSYYLPLHETHCPLIYPCFDPFLLRLPDDIGSVGSACGILSGPSSCARQFSCHSLATHLHTLHTLLDLCLLPSPPPTFALPSPKPYFLVTSQTLNLMLFYDKFHTLISHFHGS